MSSQAACHTKGTLDYIKHVSISRQGWQLQVRIMRKWAVFEKDSAIKKTLELLFLDECGDSIQCTLSKNFIDQYDHILAEDKCYKISVFYVSVNRGKYLASTHKYRLNFTNSTKVSELDDLDIPSTFYKFTDFKSILSPAFQREYLIDLIGQITDFSSEFVIIKRTGKERKRLRLELQDTEGTILPCILWGDKAIEVESHLLTSPTSPIVFAMRYGISDVFNSETHATTFFDNSIIVLNGKDRWCTEFRDRLLIERPNSSSITLKQSHTKDKKKSFDTKAFLDVYASKTLSELVVFEEVAQHVVLCTIACVLDDKGWMYYSCPKCKKSVESCAISCANCAFEFESPNISYKLKFKVSDDTGTAVFIAFDDAGPLLVGISAKELLDEMETEDRTFPRSLSEIVHKEFLFIVKSRADVANKYRNFTVVNATNDEKLIKEYKEQRESLLGQNNCEGYDAIPEIDYSQKSLPSKSSSSSSTPNSTLTSKLLKSLGQNSSEFKPLNLDDSNDGASGTRFKRIKVEKD